MDWCSGNIGLAGNSHLGIVQWFIAALLPPSFKAIAPWLHMRFEYKASDSYTLLPNCTRW
ncbi:Xaa-Pro dipeptidyl-peptidase-like domain [Fusarium oxysporum f. sp. vasinfectum]|nr:Xaa-Pro dipeptidyl-peptidase-like domain [Fusarium oxysporum f. sp. vasinfectum]KAK2926353.1 Xaa-Pro dipeptidyl-peptidase-like domain [Fusarium oxysporum f. sp. vasinfectum]